MLRNAIKLATVKVVVKRPLAADPLDMGMSMDEDEDEDIDVDALANGNGNKKPSSSREGRTHRFDVYVPNK